MSAPFSDASSGQPRGGDPAAPTARGGHYVSDRIAWSAVHRTTRLRTTTVTFGWRGKLLLSSPPVVVLAFWGSSGALTPRGVTGAIAVGFGLPLIWATVWWLRQVWVAGPDERFREVTQRQAPLEPLILQEPDINTAHPNLAFLYRPPPPAGRDTAAEAAGGEHS